MMTKIQVILSYRITNNSSSEIDLTGIYFGGLGITYQFPQGLRFLQMVKFIYLTIMNPSTPYMVLTLLMNFQEVYQ